MTLPGPRGLTNKMERGMGEWKNTRRVKHVATPDKITRKRKEVEEKRGAEARESSGGQ